MASELVPLLTFGMLLIACLYAAVGHAGASGYIAVMSLLSLAPDVVKPTALALNLMVASIATFQFWRAGHFSWPLFWPFALCAVPMAFLGGWLDLPTQAFQILVGIVLLFAAARFLAAPVRDSGTQPPPIPAALGAGASLGLLAGLTGTGGGIFLTPLVILMGWARTRTAAAISAPFILLNSAAGLTGNVLATQTLPPVVLPLVAAVVAGGAAGAYLGSRRFDPAVIGRLLAAVLVIAGAKLIFTS